MNIFKALFSGHRFFKEEFASTLLGYLFSPHMDHGLNTTFLRMFLESLNKKCEDGDINAIIESLSYVSLTDSLEEDAFLPKVQVSLEYEKCDIVVMIRNCSPEQDICLIMENKINHGSIGNVIQQISGYEDIISTKLSMNNTLLKKICILPDSATVESFRNKGGDIYWIAWKNKSYNDVDTIISVLKKLLQESADGTISPIPSDTEYLLRSLINFINDDFSGYRGIDRGDLSLNQFVREMSNGISNKSHEIEAHIVKVTKVINDIYAISDNPPDNCFSNGPIIYFKTNSGLEVCPFKIKSNGSVFIQHQGMWKFKYGKQSNKIVKEWLSEDPDFKKSLGDSFSFSFNLLLKKEKLEFFKNVIKKIKEA